MDTSVDSAARSSSSLLPVMPSWNSELASPVTLVLTHVTGEAEMILTTAAHVRGTPLPFPCGYSSDLPGTVASESPESTEANLACKDLCSKRLKVDFTCHIICYAIGHPVIRRSMDSTSQGKTMVQHFFFLKHVDSFGLFQFGSSFENSIYCPYMGLLHFLIICLSILIWLDNW